MAPFRIHDRAQALNGDRTTTGAVCLASNAGFKVQGREALRLMTRPPHALSVVRSERSWRAYHTSSSKGARRWLMGLW